MEKNNFSAIISGVGGQGIITLVSVLDQACLIEGYDIKSSELHGLSQRGGSVLTHIVFGKKVNSPMVASNGADLILSLELSEALRTSRFVSKETKFLINDHYIAFQGNLAKEEIIERLNKFSSGKANIVPAAEICKKELANDVLSGMYLLGYAVSKKLIPLQFNSIIRAIEDVIPEKYQQINIKAFKLAHG